jgi:VIT1/CCC1 family predicted Fe2+/Mn2+ transporter
MSMQRNGSLRSRHVGELAKGLSQDVSRLVKLEVELAKAEARELVTDLQARAQETVSEAQTELQTGSQRVTSKLSKNGKQAGVAGGFFAGAALFGLGAFAALTTFLILALAEAIPAWAAALVVLALYGVAAAVLAMIGRTRWHRAMPLVPTTEIRQTADNVREAVMHGKVRLTEAMPPIPEQTVETVKEDIQWAKHPTRSGTR